MHRGTSSLPLAFILFAATPSPAATKLTLREVGTARWTRGWTTLLPYPAGGKQLLLALNAGSGLATAHTLDGRGRTREISRQRWSRGWTTVLPLSLGGRPYHFFYKRSDGTTSIDRVVAGGRYQNVFRARWWNGWSVVPFRIANRQYLFFHRSISGHANIYRVEPGGRPHKIWGSSRWSRDWTHFAAIPFAAGTYLLSYKASRGDASFDRLDPRGGLANVRRMRWSTGWSAFHPFALAGRPHLVSYRARTGELAIDAVSADGRFSSRLRLRIGAGPRVFGSFADGGRPVLFAYRPNTGEVRFYRIEEPATTATPVLSVLRGPRLRIAPAARPRLPGALGPVVTLRRPRPAPPSRDAVETTFATSSSCRGRGRKLIARARKLRAWFLLLVRGARVPSPASIENLREAAWRRLSRALLGDSAADKRCLRVLLFAAARAEIEAEQRKRAAAEEKKRYKGIWGIADLHAHQFAHLAFGGRFIHGEVYDRSRTKRCRRYGGPSRYVTRTDNCAMAKALPWCDYEGRLNVLEVIGAALGGSIVGTLLAPLLDLFKDLVLRGVLGPLTDFISVVLHLVAPLAGGAAGVLANVCLTNRRTIHGPLGCGDIFGEVVNNGRLHKVGGYPHFDGWPMHDSITHQKMYTDWLHRAFDTGRLRLMVMLAVHNKVICEKNLRRAPWSRSCDYTPSIDRQLRAAVEYERYIRETQGGWYKIVRTPMEARQAIAQNKLAVVLGIESAALFNCERENECGSCRGASCVRRHVRRELDRYQRMGVRYFFPIHNSDNTFGGTAIFKEMLVVNSVHQYGRGPFVRDCTADNVSFALQGKKGLGLLEKILPFLGLKYDFDPANVRSSGRGSVRGHCNALGLHPNGRFLLQEMMARKLLIDVDHMSTRSFDDAVGIARRYRYPLYSGHTDYRDLYWTAREVGRATAEKRFAHADEIFTNEIKRTAAQIRQIRDLGGMVTITTGPKAVKRAPGSPVPSDCDGSTRSLAQVLHYATGLMGYERVGIGTDFNGLLQQTVPRFGKDACAGAKGDRRAAQLRTVQPKPVAYSRAMRDCRNYRFTHDAPGQAREGVCYGLKPALTSVPGPRAKVPERFCHDESAGGKGNCSLDGGCQRVVNICKGVLGARVWARCTDDPNKPLIDLFRGPEVRLGACLAAKKRACPRSGLAGEVCAQVSRALAEVGGTSRLDRSVAGWRDFDFNIDGFAHVGLLPDLMQDLENVGVPSKSRDVLYRSAEDFIRVWERARASRVPRP